MRETLLEAVRTALDYLRARPLLEALAIVVAGLLVAKLADIVITRLLTRWTRRTRTDYDDQLVQLLHRPVLVSVTLAGLWLALVELGARERFPVLTRGLVLSTLIVVWWIFIHSAGRVLLEILGDIERKTTLIKPRTVALLDNLIKLIVALGAIYLLLKALNVVGRLW